MALLGYMGLLHDALHLPERERLALARGKALAREFGYDGTLREPSRAQRVYLRH